MADECDVRGVRQSRRLDAVDDALRMGGANGGFEAIAECGHLLGAIGAIFFRSLQGGEKAEDERHRLGAGAQAELLRGAVQNGLNLDAVAHQQCADAARAAEFVRGDGHGRDAELAEVDWDFADCLHGVGMDQDCRAAVAEQRRTISAIG